MHTSWRPVNLGAFLTPVNSGVKKCTRVHGPSTRVVETGLKLGDVFTSDNYITLQQEDNKHALIKLLNKIWIWMYRLKKYRAADSEMLFPDEVETPMDVPARVQFQK